MEQQAWVTTELSEEQLGHIAGGADVFYDAYDHFPSHLEIAAPQIGGALNGVRKTLVRGAIGFGAITTINKAIHH